MSLKLLLKIIPCFVLAVFLGCSQPEDVSLDKFQAQYQALIKYYDQLLEARPNDPDLKIRLAEFYYKLKDYQRVEAILKGIDSRKSKIILAKAFARLKNYDYAIGIFEQLKPVPADPEYLYLYAEVLEKKNLFPQALKIYDKVKPPFEAKAKAKVKAIKTKVEEEIPPQVLEISQQAEGFINQSKDAAAIILLVDEEITINPNNTSLSTIHVIEKVLKERGKKLAEVEVGYDSTYQRVELEFARTISPDGKVTYAGKESIRDVSRYLNFPLYSNSRAFIVSMPSVDVGSIIEYKIKIPSSKLINEDEFSFIYRLRESNPIFKAKFALVVPKAKQAFLRFFNREYAKGTNLKPASEIKNEQKIYTWEFSRIKPIIPEYGMPPQVLINPAILISSFSSWDQIYQWWRSLYLDKLELSKSTKEFVKELIKEESKDLDKAKKIHEYVAQNIRYVAIEYGQGGYEPHRAQDVFTNRYGDCKDQAMLLIAMLEVAGLKSYPVLIPTRRAYSIDENFPSINFNHAICALKNGKELIFMDPTSEVTPFREVPLADQKRKVMVFLDDKWLLTEIPENKENRINYLMDISLEPSEDAVISRTLTSQGFFSSSHRYYLRHTHPALIKEDIQKKMTQISSLSRLLDYKIMNVDGLNESPVLSYKFKAAKFLNPAGNLRIISKLDQIGLDHNLISKEQRNFPLDFEAIFTKEAKVEIGLPKNLKVKYLPRSKNLENQWFNLKVSYKKYSDHVDFYQSFATKKRFVDKADYQKFKKQFEAALYLLREEIILEKSK